MIRPLREGDEAGIASLFAEVFGQPLALSTWRWKYLRGDETPPVMVGEEDGRIVCHYGAIRSTLVAEGVPQTAYAIVDVMCERRHQGRGIFRRAAGEFFARFCEGGRAALIYGFPGERHRRLGEILLGYTPIAPVYEVAKELSTTPAHWPAEVWRGLEIPEDWDERWRRIEPRFPLITRRDRATLEWRFARRPDRQYRILHLRDEPGIAIVGLEGENAYLMEFLFERTVTPVTRMRLLVAAEIVAGESGARRLIGWFPAFAAETELLLGPGGFRGAEADHRVETRFFARRYPAEWLAQSFYYSLGDYDVH